MQTITGRWFAPGRETGKFAPASNVQEGMTDISKTLEQFVRDRLADEEIVRHVVAGETGLFELLIRRHDQRVYRTARAITRNETDAEDVAQEAYPHAFQHLSQFQGRAKFSTWLLRIAAHEAIAHFHHNARFED